MSKQSRDAYLAYLSKRGRTLTYSDTRDATGCWRVTCYCHDAMNPFPMSRHCAWCGCQWPEVTT